MKLFKLNPNALFINDGGVLTIGNFDGVHLGHQALLMQLIQKSQELGLPSVVLLFEPHPKELFLKAHAPKRIYTLREKIYYLKALGIDYVACIDFNQNFSNISAEQFVKTILHEKLSAKYILIGHDFLFGKARHGNLALLQNLGQTFGFSAQEYQIFTHNNERVSSTLIRKFLQDGDIQTAQQMLGRPYAIIGRVVYGRQLAREWGFPTANIAVLPQKLSLNGVFCVKIRICGQNQEYQGVANIGYRPTIDGQKPFLEVFIFDYSGSLYGQFLEISFCHHLRKEQKFAGIEQLRMQIENDIANAKAYFSTNS